MQNVKATCLIVDDEFLAANNIITNLKSFSWIEIIKYCDNAVCAFDILTNHQVDILFLDIHMPEMTGLELLNTLTHKPYTIITTASKEHALESFELEVNDYLVKPISMQRFLKSMQRFSDFFQLQLSAQNHKTEEKSQNTISNFLHVKENYKTVKIDVQEIYYIESFREYSHIHTKERTIITKQNLSALEEELKNLTFARIHKSYIVNTRMIRLYTAHYVQILDRELPIGKSYKEKIQHLFQS